MMNPVLLIHGFVDKSIVFNKMSSYLKDKGYEIHSIDLTPNYGTADLKILAKQVKNYIDNTFSIGQKIDLIGFSMGGLVTRYYLQRMEGNHKIEKYINISAPNNGTLTAYFLPFEGIKQMRPESDFLLDLNKDLKESLLGIKSLFLWTPYDLMIFPARSSIMVDMPQESIPVLTHKWMISDGRVLARVDRFLSDNSNN